MNARMSTYTTSRSSAQLCRLFRILYCSLPRYVVGAKPYISPGDEQLFKMVCTIAQQQDQMAHILAKAIHARGLPIPPTTFPMSYTSLHDLELRYLISRMHDAQRQLVEELETLACELAGDRPAHEIAVEALSQANEHLTMIEAALVPGNKRRSTIQSDHTRGPQGRWITEPTAGRDALTEAARRADPYNRADARVFQRKGDVGRYKSNLARLIANRSSSLPVEGSR